MVRASLSEDKALHCHGHERCLSALAALLQFTHAYRQGRDWSCECRYCRFLGGLRNYLAHLLDPPRRLRVPGRAVAARQRLDASAQRDARRQPRLLPALRPAGGRRPRHTADQEAPQVRRSGPPARGGRPAGQSRARRRRLPGVPVGELRRVARPAWDCRRRGLRPADHGHRDTATLGFVIALVHWLIRLIGQNLLWVESTTGAVGGWVADPDGFRPWPVPQSPPWLRFRCRRPRSTCDCPFGLRFSARAERTPGGAGGPSHGYPWERFA